jgi:hypothetical protein
MAELSETTTALRACDWRVGGYCFQRLKNRCRKARGDGASLADEKPLTIPHLLRLIRDKSPTAADLRCEPVAGQPCPFVPLFNAQLLEFSFCGELLRHFDKQSRQTELLEAFQLRGWPHSVKNPLGSASPCDAENGLSDIVYELNENQHPRQRVHFWCDGRSVHWEIVDDEPASQ